jgi:UDP-N-acetylglucosamine 2-epimerase (non-hydrolysing)
MGLEPSKYFLVTLHRAENVDPPGRLNSYVSAFDALAERYGYPVVVSTHPRTRQKLAASGLTANSELVRFIEPLGLLDFIYLERRASCVLTDSGTVQEEACIFGVPNVTLRDVTERAETTEAGSNMLAGCDPELILQLVNVALCSDPTWEAPSEYRANSVSDVVLKVVLSYLHGF